MSGALSYEAEASKNTHRRWASCQHNSKSPIQNSYHHRVAGHLVAFVDIASRSAANAPHELIVSKIVLPQKPSNTNCREQPPHLLPTRECRTRFTSATTLSSADRRNLRARKSFDLVPPLTNCALRQLSPQANLTKIEMLSCSQGALCFAAHAIRLLDCVNRKLIILQHKQHQTELSTGQTTNMLRLVT